MAASRGVGEGDWTAGGRPDLGALRRRFLLVLMTLGICVLASHAHIREVGREFRYRLDGFAGESLTPGDILIDPPGMGHVESIEYADGTPVVVLAGDEPGDGMVSVNAPEHGEMFRMGVSPRNVVTTDEINFRGWEAIGWSLVACFSVAFAVSAWNAVGLWRRSWYGYEMVTYLGVAMFCGVQAWAFARTMLVGRPEQFADLVRLVTLMADRFLLLSLPIMLLLASVTCISNLVLIRREGLRPTNLLGFLMNGTLVAAIVIWRVSGQMLFDSFDAYLLSFFATSVISMAISYFLALFSSTCVCALLASLHRPSFPRDYLMVLGCGLRDDGTPTPLLAGRLDAARGYADEQVARGHGFPTFVPSGGQGSDEPFPESESMSRYLTGHGVSDGAILQEDRSTDTRENFLFSSVAIMGDWASKGRDGQPSVAFATTNYHVFRSYVYAHQAGMAAEGIASPTRHYFWPNAFLREFVGLLVARWSAILKGLACVVVLYGGAEWLMLMAG